MDDRHDTRLVTEFSPVEEMFTPAEDGVALAVEDETPKEERLPRRLAALGLAGGLAALVSVLRGKNEASAHPGQDGLFIRTRIETNAANVPNNTNRVVRAVCPNASGQTVRVMGGGFNTTTNNPNFYIKTSAPDTNRSWLVDAHNVGSGATHAVGVYALCAYFRS